MSKIRYLLIINIFFLIQNNALAINLEDALISAYQNNNAILAAIEDIKLQAEETPRALSEFIPNIEFRTSNYKTRSKGFNQQQYLDNQIINIPSNIDNYGNSQSLMVHQPIFNGGRSIVNLKLAKKAFEKSVKKLLATEQEVMFTTISKYADIIQAKEALMISKNRVLVLKKTLESIEERFKLGDLTKTDVSQTKADLAKAQSGRIEAQSVLQKAIADFKSVTGIEPVNLEELKIANNLPTDLDQAINLATNNYPDIMMNKIDIELNDLNTIAAKGILLPSVALEGSISKGRSPISNSTKSVSNSRQAAINMSIPIFQGGKEYSNIRMGKVKTQKSKMVLQNAIENITNKTINVWEDFESTKATIEANIERIAAADVALEGIKQQAYVGSSTTLEVLTSEQNLYDAKLELSRAKRNNLVQSYQLKLMTGQLSAAQLNLNTNIYNPMIDYNKVKTKLIGIN